MLLQNKEKWKKVIREKFDALRKKAVLKLVNKPESKNEKNPNIIYSRWVLRKIYIYIYIKGFPIGT